MILPFSLVCLEPKTTLSADQKKINGDDEHGWTSENVLILKADATR
jgi:ATP-dependent phosphoenolpyruvate carboxykinase